MFYSINLLLCAISAFCFKNILTFLLFGVGAWILYHFAIRKLSDITVILYILNILIILIGGFVIWLLPNKEDIIPSIIVDTYYLGPIELLLFFGFLVSLVFDIKFLLQKKKIKNRIVKKQPQKVNTEKNKEFKENVQKIENTIKEKTEEIKKLVENKKTEKKVKNKKEKTKKVTKKPVRKTSTKKEEK